MTLDDITIFYGYKRDKLPHTHKQTKSHDPDAACAIENCFLAYGWSSQELLRSETKVMVVLRFHQSKRPHADEGPGDSESANKRRRIDQPGATPRPDHDFPATSLDQFSPGSIDRATSSGIDNTVESMNRSNSSHLIPFDARNGTRNLTDPATMGNLDYAFNSSDELTDPATMDNLDYAFNSDELTDPATMGNLCDTINGPAADDLGYAADFLQSIHDQPMDALPNPDEALWWTINESDPSTHMFLQGAASATQLYFMNDFTYQSHDPHLESPERKHTGCLDPRT
jgi:hypothetical protein